MSKSIKLKLSSKGVNDLINKLQALQDNTEKAVREAVTEAVYPTVNTITSVASQRADTGDSLSGIGWEFVGDNTLLIYQEGTHVFENEFGNGLGFGGYPKPEVIPNGQPTKKGKYTFEPNPQSRRWFQGRNKDGTIKKRSASGQFPDAQMYQGAMVLREELPTRIKQKVGDVLSQI